MGSVVMDGAVVESNSIVAAGSVVLEGTIIESGTIYAGVPAKKVKDLDKEKINRLTSGVSDNYVLYSSWFIDED